MPEFCKHLCEAATPSCCEVGLAFFDRVDGSRGRQQVEGSFERRQIIWGEYDGDITPMSRDAHSLVCLLHLPE